MFSKQSIHHGHGHKHGHHKKMHRHGGKHERFGPHFKHPGDHHMGFGRKHFRGLDFERAWFSESEMPDTTTPNAEAGTQQARESNLPREFHMRRQFWKYGKCCCCEKDILSDNAEKNAETGKETDSTAMTVENAEGKENTDAPTSGENVDGLGNAEICRRIIRHFLKHHRVKEYARFEGSCPRCMRKETETKDNEANAEKETVDNLKEGFEGRRFWGGHHKGKRGHGFRHLCKQCREEIAGETEGTSGDEGGVKHGFIGKHHRHHHGGRRGHKLGRGGPEFFDGEGRFEGRHGHGGKWRHGPHRMHGGWRRHECWMLKNDAEVKTGEPNKAQGNETQEVSGQQNPNAGAQTMEQEVSQGHAEPEKDQVLEVADNLRKSSIE